MTGWAEQSNSFSSPSFQYGQFQGNTSEHLMPPLTQLLQFVEFIWQYQLLIDFFLVFRFLFFYTTFQVVINGIDLGF